MPDYVDPMEEMLNMLEMHPELTKVINDLCGFADRVGYAGVFVFLALLQETLKNIRAFEEMFGDLEGPVGNPNEQRAPFLDIAEAE